MSESIFPMYCASRIVRSAVHPDREEVVVPVVCRIDRNLCGLRDVFAPNSEQTAGAGVVWREKHSFHLSEKLHVKPRDTTLDTENERSGKKGKVADFRRNSSLAPCTRAAFQRLQVFQANLIQLIEARALAATNMRSASANL